MMTLQRLPSIFSHDIAIASGYLLVYADYLQLCKGIIAAAILSSTERLTKSTRIMILCRSAGRLASLFPGGGFPINKPDLWRYFTVDEPWYQGFVADYRRLPRAIWIY